MGVPPEVNKIMLKLTANTSAIHEFLGATQVPPQLLNGFLNFPHGFSELLCINLESDFAFGARNIQVVFKPTQRLARLNREWKGEKQSDQEAKCGYSRP